MRSTEEANSQPSLTECAEEFAACAKDFWYWCGSYCQIEDKESHGSVLFKPYECQRAMGELMLQGKWVLALKARRLGITWLVIAYAVWLVTFHPDRTAAILNQADEYAQDNLDRCRYILDRLPAWMQPRRTVDHKRRITFAHGCELRSFAPSTKSMRSLAADLVIADEAAYIDLLSECLGAAEPTVETSKGQIVVLSTSSGPSGKFYDAYQEAEAGKSKYTPLFFDWRSRPGRTEEWYEQEKKTHESDPLYIKREYPSTPEEAFESAEGRVYPMFVRSGAFVKRLAAEIKPQRFYRGIDWGGVDPFVCLWGCLVPGDGPGLTVDPSCENLIREMLAYSYEDTGKLKDCDNHTCFAANTLIDTPYGPKTIQSLRVGDKIFTHLGVGRVDIAPQNMGVKKLVKLRLSTGSDILCTEDHPLALVGGGWVRAGGAYQCQLAQISQFTTELAGVDTRRASAGPTACITARELEDVSGGYMSTFGSRPTDQYRRAMRFTILTKTPLTMPLPISRAWPLSSIADNMSRTLTSRGTNQRRAGRLRATAYAPCGSKESPLTSAARIVGDLLAPQQPIPSSTAQRNAGIPIDIRPKRTMSLACASFAGQLTNASARRRNLAARVPVRGVTVLAVESSGCAPVYNFATSDGTYCTQGIITSNCDALRYIVTGCNVVQHIHIYRELYIPESAARYDLNDLAKMILEMSNGERYEATIADRSRPDSMRLLGSHGIPCRGQPNLSGGRIGEIEQGIVRVNALIVGTAKTKGVEAMPRTTVKRQFAGRFFG